MVEDLMKAAEIALAVLKKKGARWADVAAARSCERAVVIENASIKAAESARGYYATNGLDRDEIEFGAAFAYDMAVSADKDPDFVSLPAPEEAEEVEGLYDEKVENFSIQECVRIARENCASAKKVCKDALVMGDIGAGFAESVLLSLSGIQIYKKSTTIEAGISSIINRKGEIGSFHDFDAGHNLADVELADLGGQVTREALKFLGAKKIKPGRMPVVLGPLGSLSFLHSIAASANAESCQRGRSYFAGKYGEKIASEKLTFVDDPLVARGLFSRSHDGEGAKTKRVTIIDRGILAGLLYNSYTANKAKVPNTGHGRHSGGISPTNFRVALGKRTAEEIIRDTREGLYINMGGISADGTSGDISSSVDFGFKIEGGELAYPVASAMIGGNIIELLKNIEEVSRDYREEPGNILPTIKIGDVQVTGEIQDFEQGNRKE